MAAPDPIKPAAGAKLAEYSAPSAAEQLSLQAKAMDLESGWLGKVFGNEKNGPTNIAGFIGACAIVSLMIVVFTRPAAEVGEILKFLTPIITGVLGFVFGKRR